MPTPIVPFSGRTDIQGSGFAETPPSRRHSLYTIPKKQGRPTPGSKHLTPTTHNNQTGSGFGPSTSARKPFKQPSKSARAADSRLEDDSLKRISRQLPLPAIGHDEAPYQPAKSTVKRSTISISSPPPGAKRRRVSAVEGTSSRHFKETIDLDDDVPRLSPKAVLVSPQQKRNKPENVLEYNDNTYPASSDDDLSEPEVIKKVSKLTPVESKRFTVPKTKFADTPPPITEPRTLCRAQLASLNYDGSNRMETRQLRIMNKCFMIVDPKEPSTAQTIKMHEVDDWDFDGDSLMLSIHCKEDQPSFADSRHIEMIFRERNAADSLTRLIIAGKPSPTGFLSKLSRGVNSAWARTRHAHTTPAILPKESTTSTVVDLASPRKAQPERLKRLTRGSQVPVTRRDASQPFASLDSFAKPTVTLPNPRETRQRARLKELAKSSDPVLVYPHKAASSVTLFPDDVERLKPGEFLNDSLIDYYLRYNFDHLPEQRRSEAYLFNTFFYKKLTQKSTVKGKETATGHSAVEKWTRKANVDLFSKKYVIIPVNEALHWYLVVIANLDKCVFGEWTDTRSQKSHIEEDVPEVPDVMEISDEEETASSRPATSTPKNEMTIFEFDDDTPAEKAPAKPTLAEALRAEHQQKMNSRSKISASLAALRAEDELTTKSTAKRKSPKKTKAKPSLKFLKPGKHIEQDEPVILILDSLRNRHNKVYGTIKQYLAAEAEVRRGQKLDTEQINTCLAAVPGQDNFSDCGLFLIHYAEKMLQEPDAVLRDLLQRTGYKREESFKKAQEAQRELWEIDKIASRRVDMVDEILTRGEAWKKEHEADMRAKAAQGQGQAPDEEMEELSLMETAAPEKVATPPATAEEEQEARSEHDPEQAMTAMLGGEEMTQDVVPATQSPVMPSALLSSPLSLDLAIPASQENLVTGKAGPSLLDGLVDVLNDQDAMDEDAKQTVPAAVLRYHAKEPVSESPRGKGHVVPPIPEDASEDPINLFL